MKAKGAKALAVLAVCIVAALVLIGSSVYFTTEDQYAVVTTLGKPAVVENSGLHFLIPFVQDKTIISKNIHGIEIGYNSKTGEVIESEATMITVDYNFVNVDFYVEYRVTDPVKYLYNSQDPVGILKMLCQSYIRDTIGLYRVDDVITTGKSEIQASIKDKILNRLEKEDLGITLVSITIQDAEPPTQAVQEAFKAVETAKQGAETAINQAKAYENSELPKAQAEADKLIQNAEYLKQNRINDATKMIARFEAMYKEYSNNPGITKIRMYYEAISDVLSGVKIYIDCSDGTTQKLLPIDNFVQGTSSVNGGAE